MARLPRRFGRYVLVEQLGHGGMGTVYLARPIDRTSGLPTPIVLKVLKTDLNNNETFVRRFKHEAKIATRIDSPHVVKVYDAGRVGEQLYFAMEHVIGFNLANMLNENLREKKVAPLSFVRLLGTGALAGLEALHSARDDDGAPLGFVHRDLSPKNVMVGPNLNIYLIDLGIGKSSVQDWKTQTGVVLGTVGYMSPEQVTGKSVDLRSDLYALGIVLFELLTQTRYIERGPVVHSLRASVAPAFRRPSSIRAGIPAAIDGFLERALAHDREERFQSAREMSAALVAALPVSDPRAEVVELAPVREMIEDALAIAEPGTEIRVMLEQTIVDEVEPVLLPTEIFASRVPGTEVVAAPQMTRAEVTRTPAAMASVSLARARRRRSRAPVWAIGATFVVGAVAIGLIVGRMWSEPAEVRVEAVVPVAPPVVGVVPRVEEPPAAAERGLPDRTVTEPRAPAKKTTKREPLPAREETPPQPPPAEKITAESRVDRLLRRAHAIEKKVSEESPHRAAIESLLADLLQLRASKRLEDERAEVDRVAKELDDLERRLGR